MFNLGFQEILLILAVAIIVVGPKNLPNVARALGRAYAEFRKAMQEFQETVESTEVVREFKEELNKVQHGINPLVNLDEVDESKKEEGGKNNT